MSRVINNQVRQVDDLCLRVRAVSSISVLDEFVNGCKNAIDGVDRVIDHLSHCCLSILQFLRGNASINAVEMSKNVSYRKGDATRCSISYCLEVLRLDRCCDLLTESLIDALNFPKDTKAFSMLVAHRVGHMLGSSWRNDEGTGVRRSAVCGVAVQRIFFRSEDEAKVAMSAAAEFRMDALGIDVYFSLKFANRLKCRFTMNSGECGDFESGVSIIDEGRRGRHGDKH